MADYRHFSRKARRLAEYDYRSEGWYFVTICTKDRVCYFGEILDQEMVLSDAGLIVHDYWLEIPKYNPQVSLGEFVVMPNHVHGILGIEGVEGVALSLDDAINPAEGSDDVKTAPNEFLARLSSKSGSLSRVIGGYKSACSRMIQSVNTEPFAWQPRFHDLIIRDQQAFKNIERYILDNPARWNQDDYFSPPP